jgi:hypothetical protein
VVSMSREEARLVPCMAYSSILKMGGDVFSQNVELPPNCMALQPRKAVFFTVTTVGIPNPACYSARCSVRF